MSFCIFHAQFNTPTHLSFLAWCRVTVPIGVGCAVNTNSFYTPSSQPRAIVLCRSRGNRVQSAPVCPGLGWFMPSSD